MKLFPSRFLAVLTALYLCVPVSLAAQDSLVGFWLAKIDGDPESRSLIINEAAPTSDGTLLTARYGMSSQGTGPVEAKAIKSGSQRQLLLTTQAGSRIAATEDGAGRLVGTFSLKNGVTKNIIITRSTEEDLQRLVAQGKPSAAEDVIPTGVSHWASRPKILVGDNWQFEFANRRFAKPGCQYQLSVERITGSNVYVRTNFPDGCEVSITTALPVGPGTLQRFDLNFNHYHYSAEPYPAFDFPLYVGKTWNRKWQWVVGGWTYNDTVAASVEAFEKVTTPAGTFDTYRIRLLRTYNGSKVGSQTQSGTLEDTFWYSPQVKYFVKRTYVDSGWAHITRELTAYSVNGGAPVLSSQSSIPRSIP